MPRLVESQVQVQQMQCQLHLHALVYSEQPQCWQNFVNHIDLNNLDHYKSVMLIQQALESYNITWHDRCVQFPDLETYYQWIVTYA